MGARGHVDDAAVMAGGGGSREQLGKEEVNELEVAEVVGLEHEAALVGLDSILGEHGDSGVADKVIEWLAKTEEFLGKVRNRAGF
mmetsp:Transcript_42274/g.88372  ORF Transcript_42274/g.88372 Transcript_42274/m.88372 type:complete len:85 (+) Transcript_42274:453-707(+)